MVLEAARVVGLALDSDTVPQVPLVRLLVEEATQLLPTHLGRGVGDKLEMSYQPETRDDQTITKQDGEELEMTDNFPQ